MGLLLQREAAVAMVYLCVMATTVALLFQNVGQRWSRPRLRLGHPVVGVGVRRASSVLFYGDPVTGRLLAGFGLIFVAVLCSETKFGFLRKKSEPNVRPVKKEDDLLWPGPFKMSRRWPARPSAR